MQKHLGVHSDLVEGSVLLGALTAALALAEEAILVGAVLVEARGWLGLAALTALLLYHCGLCYLQQRGGVACSASSVHQVGTRVCRFSIPAELSRSPMNCH